MMRVTNKQRKVVVIGAGITGLTTAFYMQKQVREEKLPVEVLLLDASLRTGGKIETLRQDGYIIERGPESFYDQHGDVERLAQDLYIRSKMMYNNIGDSYIAVHGELHPVPNHFTVSRTSNDNPSFMTTNLLSLGGKLRAMRDIVLPRGEHQDESVAQFFKRRVGIEVVENFIEPLLAGTFAGDIDQLSMRSMFPELYELEAEHRSLLKGLKKTDILFLPNEVRHQRGVYQTFERGLQTLVESLEESLVPNTLRKGVRVEQVESTGSGVVLHLNNGEKLTADELIIATPFAAAKKMLQCEGVFEDIQPVKSATIATVTLAFKKEQIQKYEEAINFFVSRNSSYAITSCTFSHNKWDGVAPDDQALLRVYLGRVGDETIVELSDSEIEKIVLRDLEEAIGLTGQPLLTIVSRWKEAMPQYVVGHEEAVQAIQQNLAKLLPTVHVTGSSYEGISIPSCVAQGRAMAKRILTKLLQADYTDA